MDPLLLALDTSGAAPGAAVLRGERVLGCAEGALGAGAMQGLLPLVERALGAAGAPLRAIEAFAIAIGPGSFTGLRVGVATLKGLAFGAERPVAAVSSLRALALGAPDPERPVLAVLDARRGEVYAAAWSGRAAVLADAALLPAGVYWPEDLLGMLSGAHLGRAGARLQRVGEVAALGGAGGAAAPAPEDSARAAAREASAVLVGRLGLLELRAGRVRSAASLVPEYLRRAQAEVVRAAREEARGEAAAAPGATRRPQS